MRVLLATYGWRGDVELVAGLALQLPTIGAQVPVCAPPDWAELLGNVSVPLVPIGGWR
jgi:vancomycin aglycone glucosyltransferase